MTNKHMSYVEVLNMIETIMQTHSMGFTNISLTPIKAVFSLECDVLKQLFKALLELQKLQFLPSLALIHGAHTQLLAWEAKMQREVWSIRNCFFFQISLLFFTFTASKSWFVQKQLKCCSCPLLLAAKTKRSSAK